MSDSAKWVSSSSPYLAPSEPSEADAWAQEAASHAGRGTQRLAEVAEVIPPLAVAAALRLAADETAIVRRRVMYFNDAPVELTDSYYPTALAQGTGIGEPRKIRGGAITLLAQLGHPVTSAVDDLTARRATAEEQHALRLADGDVVVILNRLSLTSDDRPVEASIMTIPADNRHFQYRTQVG